jgi:hypothetical protein
MATMKRNGPCDFFDWNGRIYKLAGCFGALSQYWWGFLEQRKSSHPILDRRSIKVKAGWVRTVCDASGIDRFAGEFPARFSAQRRNSSSVANR